MEGTDLLERVLEAGNLRRALHQVRRNQGAPGIDGMTVDDLGEYLKTHWPTIRAALLEGTYVPQPVRRTEIPKAGGGTRNLGIPTVLDRFIEQALLQVLQEEWDPTFSESSYGFRPQRSAHQAVGQAQAYIRAGYTWVVDIDLEQFFDRVNHDVLMSRVRRRVKDRRVVHLDPSVPEGGSADPGGERGAHGGRDPARGAALTPAGKPAAGRARPGAGEARPPVRPLCRRCEHLRAESTGGGTGDGECDACSGAQASAQGQ